MRVLEVPFLLSLNLFGALTKRRFVFPSHVPLSEHSLEQSSSAIELNFGMFWKFPIVLSDMEPLREGLYSVNELILRLGHKFY